MHSSYPSSYSAEFKNSNKSFWINFQFQVCSSLQFCISQSHFTLGSVYSSPSKFITGQFVGRHKTSFIILLYTARLNSAESFLFYFYFFSFSILCIMLRVDDPIFKSWMVSLARDFFNIISVDMHDSLSLEQKSMHFPIVFSNFVFFFLLFVFYFFFFLLSFIDLSMRYMTFPMSFFACFFEYLGVAGKDSQSSIVRCLVVVDQIVVVQWHLPLFALLGLLLNIKHLFDKLIDYTNVLALQWMIKSVKKGDKNGIAKISIKNLFETKKYILKEIINHYIQYFKMQALKPNKEEKIANSSLKSSTITLKQSIWGKCTNLVYKLGAIGGIKRVPHLLTKTTSSTDRNVILGKDYATKEEAKKMLKEVIWFTYRQRLKIAEDINSDVGWGCLPRVGQMLLAQTLIRMAGQKDGSVSKEVKKEVIESFLDDESSKSKYSLNKILKMARIKFALAPGQWFHIGQIAEVLRKLQNQDPMQETQKLKIIFFNQAALFVNEILRKGGVGKCQCEKTVAQSCTFHKLTNEKKNKTENKTKQQSELITPVTRLAEIQQKEDQEHQFQLYYENESDRKQSPKTENKEELKHSLLILISVRVATETMDKDDFWALKELLSLKSSMGIIGGVPKKALYIVGHSNNEFVYLDPHYVQEYVDRENLQKNYQTFFCQDFRTINREAIDPSMALAFYLKNLEDVVEVIEKIDDLRKQFERKEKVFFITILDKNEFNIDGQLLQNDENYDYSASNQYQSLEFQNIAESP